MELEFHQLDMKYETLSIIDGESQNRLMASLASGQQNPVLVSRSQNSRYVLIDGYQRVAGLKKLGRDKAWAMVLEMDEIGALVFKFTRDAKKSRTAIEEGWFVRELRDGHGVSLDGIAAKLNRSKSWVSRRLGLVSALSEAVQSAVRSGAISPQAAMKYLVPLARANAGQCDELVERIQKLNLSVRDIARIYTAWKNAPSGKKSEVVRQPEIFIRIQKELERQREIEEQEERFSIPGYDSEPSPIGGGTLLPGPAAVTSQAGVLARDLHILKRVCLRAEHRILSGILPDRSAVAAWEGTFKAFQRLGNRIGRSAE